MPRGLSRTKHPELYGGAKKNIGTSRRGLKTGGRTAQSSNRSTFNSGIGATGRYDELHMLAIIRANLTLNTGTSEVSNQLDNIIASQLRNIATQIEAEMDEQNEDVETRAEGVVLDRSGQQPPAFNPNPPAPQGSGYQRPTA